MGIELVLRVAPGARQLWTARFDHTQRALSENVLVASRYPGGGLALAHGRGARALGARRGAAEQLAELR